MLRVLSILVLAVASPPQGGQIRLEPVPLRALAFGLQIQVPAGAVVNTQVVEARISYLVSDGPERMTWTMRIAQITSTLADPSAAALADQQIRAAKASGRNHRIISNQEVDYGGVRGRLLYLRRTLGTGGTGVAGDAGGAGGAEAVNGWLILPTGGRTFLVLSVVMTADHFDRLQPLFNACFATVELSTRDRLASRRKAQLERGRAIIDTLTPQRLRAAVGERHWYRIYRPGVGPAGDTEIGFLSMQAIAAPRGRLDPGRSPQEYGSMESEEGLMVVIEARAVLDASGGRYLDIQGRYWMAWDRSTESWSVRQTERQGEASRTSAETGVRSGAVLNVIHSSKEQFTRQPTKWTIPSRAYLSQPEVYLLGTLLMRDGSQSGELAFYYYDSRQKKLPMRIDQWAAAGDGSGRWVLTTRPLLEADPITQIFDAQGTRLKRIDSDGTVTERIEPAALRRLWQSKGLLAP